MPSMTPRGAPGRWRTRSTASVCRPGSDHSVANASTVPARVGDDDRADADVALVEAAHREPLLDAAALGQPRVGHRGQRRHQRATFGGISTRICHAQPLEVRDRRAHRAMAAALEGEVRQEHARVLAQLHERQPVVGVDVQPVLRRLVDDRQAAVVVAALEELPDQRFRLAGRADRFAEGHPGVAVDAVHQAGRARRVPEQRLVAQQHQRAARAWTSCAPAPRPPRARRRRESRMAGRGRRISRATPTASSASTTPALARRNRDMSPYRSTRHHSSCR